MQVGGIAAQLPATEIGNGRKIGVFRGGDHVYLAKAHGLGYRLPRPLPGVDVIGTPPLPHQVERDGGELGAGAALQKQHRVVLGDAQQLPQGCLGMLGHPHKLGAAVAHFHH